VSNISPSRSVRSSFYSLFFFKQSPLRSNCRYKRIYPKGANVVNLIQVLIGHAARETVIEIEEETCNWSQHERTKKKAVSGL